MEQAPVDSVQVELDTCESPFLPQNPEQPTQHRDDDPDVETSKGHRHVFRDRRTLYFCIGVLTASVVAVCIFVGMHFRPDSVEDEGYVNTTVPIKLHNKQRENVPFSCADIPECPQHCESDMCAKKTSEEGSGAPVCTCLDKCEKDYKLINSSGRYKCIPKCCTTEESFGQPCCPEGLVNVTSGSGELLCCPSHLSKMTRDVVPPFLESKRKDSGETVDLCFTLPPPGRTLGKEFVDFPSKPLTCI
jgi:hypothetical protein